MQPNYNSLGNLPKTFHLQRHSTGRLTQVALDMCLSNRETGFQRGAQLTTTPEGVRTETLVAFCKHSTLDQHWTSVIQPHVVISSLQIRR